MCLDFQSKRARPNGEPAPGQSIPQIEPGAERQRPLRGSGAPAGLSDQMTSLGQQDFAPGELERAR